MKKMLQAALRKRQSAPPARGTRRGENPPSCYACATGACPFHRLPAGWWMHDPQARTHHHNPRGAGLDIAGYRIVRTLGRGGMATVYLALQESVQREVALKVMSKALLGDEQFGERFLREARIAARLRHPNVVQVHDVGVSGEHHYIAMEYLPGGPVMGRIGEPRPVAFALRVVRQIAGALDYAGAHGIVHRDIKPDNVLLREDGSAVLTDFGIAHASDASRMTRTGAIIGTPHYMSPEQARGLPLDGRADLYSLGILLYEMLVGKVPYQAEDSLAVGIMHITAPMPRLPEDLAWLQPVLDGLLAKDPDGRYQSGAQVVAAIRGIEQASSELRETRVTPPADAAHLPPQRYDEPRLGRIDEVLRTPARSRGAPASQSGRGLRWLLAGLLVAVLAGGALYLFQDQIRAGLPVTRMNSLLLAADEALDQGNLSGSDTSARELYLAALALDPDSLAARRGVREVGQRLVAAARAALQNGDSAPARELVAQAAVLGLSATDVAELSRSLQAEDARGVALVDLLDAARGALDAGRLDEGEDSAVSLYRRILASQPGNAVAVAGLRDALGQLLAQAAGRIAAGDLEAGSALVERVAALDPAHLGLPEARARLALARQARADDLAARVDDADALLARGHLVPPRQPNAQEAYQAVLADDPNQPRAREGLRKVATALLGQASRRIDDYRFDEAQALIDQAQALAPDLAALPASRRHLEDVRARRERAQAQQDGAAGEADLPDLLARARAAADAGQFLAPPGDSAYDLYRAALSRAPGNAEARAGLAGLPDRAMRRFEEAMVANRLSAARRALDAVAAISAGDARLPGARQRLARSYMAYASERLGAGEIDLAARAFDQARELDPANTDLPALQARLEQARGG